MLNNLSNFFEKGNSFSSIDTVKCALAFIMTVASCQSLNEHPLNFNLTNEVYSLRLPVSKTSFVWDWGVLFIYLENCRPIGYCMIKHWHVSFLYYPKLGSYDSLPIEGTLTLHNAIILIKSVLNKDQNHYYYDILRKIFVSNS